VAEVVGNGPLLSAMQVARKHGLSYQTVNYYTNLGLLVAVKRQRNHRLYDASETERRLRAVEALKFQGYPLTLIRQRLAVSHGS
jgi:DNA-binding transcriptional MerR regulator